MTKKNYHHGDLKNALIQAGWKILAREGVGGLSLRKVAQEAGVSHAAPYAHFADKQALIAAISTDGFSQLYERLSQVAAQHQSQPREQLIETAWAYLQFAQANPDRFKLMFSGVLEKEKDYPEFVEISYRNLGLIVSIVEACQAVGVLRPGPAEAIAISVWSLVHGFVLLLLEGQIPHTLFEKTSLREAFLVSLAQVLLPEP